MPNRDVYTARPANLRDFSGGWNCSDNDHNLASKYQPVSDNVIVGTDGAIGPRFGFKLYADLRQGTSASYSQSVTFSTTNASPRIRINWTGHPFSTGDHITIASIGGTISNITDQPTGTYGVVKNDANSFDIYVRTAASAGATSATLLLTCTRDTHMLGGDVLDMAYFQQNIIIFTDIGEIIGINTQTSVITRLFDASKSLALAGAPTGWRKPAGESPLLHVSFDTFKQTLLAVNGRFNDKPLEIDMTRATPVQYLVDPATVSNAFVYSADFILCFNGYVCLLASNNTSTPTSNKPTTLDISAKNTSGVFVGNASPADAVQIDLGRVTQTIDPTITGVSNIRDRMYVGFYDSSILGKLGIYTTGGVHDPDFTDQVPLHGCLNHRVLCNLGNDLLLTDFAGVPAFSQSILNSVITPDRISQLIDPAMNAHFAKLSATTMKYKPFALWNVRDRQYMMFVPKFDSSTVFTSVDPLYVAQDLAPLSRVLVYGANHPLEAGDYVDVTGSTGVVGLTDTSINGRRRVVEKVDANYFIMEVGTVPTSTGRTGGGTITFTPVNDENIGYVFTYNTQLRIKRWTRFRQLSFTAGTVSREGRVFFSKAGRIYKMGTINEPIYADAVGDYTYASFTNSFNYAIGDIIPDSTDGKFYRCLVAHTSQATGTFSDERTLFTDYWEEYLGTSIAWYAETPWSDYSDRNALKVNKTLRISAQGTDRFTVQTFVDNLYRDPNTSDYAPAATMEFVAESGGLFGLADSNYAGGRNTRDQQYYSYPFRCLIAKVRMSGSTKKPLKISGLFFSYQKGSPMR